MIQSFLLTFWKNMCRIFVSIFFSFICFATAYAQNNKPVLLKPDRIFDGESIKSGFWVLIDSGKIQAIGAPGTFVIPSSAVILTLKGQTLLPGLIEGHSHVFLHPYNEVKWEDQVLKESRAERAARAANHLKATLKAGFTTIRDLGTEGAMYDDVGIKQAVAKGVIQGPDMLVATRAIVATGSYAPLPSQPDIDLPRGAAETDGIGEMMKEVRTQIGKGADLIKVYADYRWGPDKSEQPTFTQDELNALVATAASSGRPVAAHAATVEGMRRAILAGVSTIEHGDDGTQEVFVMMKQRNIGYCATLAAGEAYAEYGGWKKGVDPDTENIISKKKSFKLALEAGVIICMGGDVGVYAHGTNSREMELMVEYGMKPLDVLRSATSVNARVFGISNKAGSIRPGLPADILVVEGDPSVDIFALRKVKAVFKAGKQIF
jgi:imidazolonepropionase-like amidohydrolase